MHAPYCHLWPAQLYNDFSYYLINETISEEKVTEHKMCFDFSLQLFSEIFFIVRRIKKDIIKNVYLFSCRVLVALRRC
jgi:hypothetical protein